MTIPWLTVSVLRRSNEQDDEEQEQQASPTLHASEHEGSDGGVPRLSNRSRLRIDMPPTNAPFTLAQNRTPGWDTPWTSAHPNGSGDQMSSLREHASQHDEEKETLTPWQRRRKRLRAYIMYNLYVPLVRHAPVKCVLARPFDTAVAQLFRLCNIVLTTAALAIAIRIRIIEQRNGVMGALGPSPYVCVHVFAVIPLNLPLTEQ